MDDILVSLFGSPAKVKILRLFLLNPETPFFTREITSRTKCTSRAVARELDVLIGAGIVKKRTLSKQIKMKRDVDIAAKKEVKSVGYVLNETFPYLDPLRTLLTSASIHADEALAKRFSSAGKIKLFVAAGLFIQHWDSRIDLLIVGDELDLKRIAATVETIESEVGKEIGYSVFNTKDFEYRFNVHDRLVRDVMDYPHVTLIDRIRIEPK